MCDITTDQDIDKFLEHFGVKGMKWGVRKTRSSNDNQDVVLKRGSEVRNISKDAPRRLNGHLYVSSTKKDNAYYRGPYAQQLKFFLGADKVFDNSFEVTKDLKSPGKKKRVETFKKMYEDNPEAMAKALAETKVTTSLVRLLAQKAGLPVKDRYVKKYSKLGEEALKSDDFRRLMSQTLTFDRPVRAEYFSRLMRQGYNATVDDNDALSGAESSLIVFKGKGNLKKKDSVALSDSDIKLAIEEFDRLSKKPSRTK